MSFRAENAQEEAQDHNEKAHLQAPGFYTLIVHCDLTVLLGSSVAVPDVGWSFGSNAYLHGHQFLVDPRYWEGQIPMSEAEQLLLRKKNHWVQCNDCHSWRLMWTPADASSKFTCSMAQVAIVNYSLTPSLVRVVCG